MGILHPREQNFHPTKCSTIFNRLNIWEQAPGANWANLKTLPRVYWHVQNEPGTCSGNKPLVFIGLKDWLVVLQGKFALTNQKHYLDLGSDVSSVWNFCSRSSHVISGGNQRWHREMLAVYTFVSDGSPYCFDSFLACSPTVCRKVQLISSRDVLLSVRTL